MVFDHSRSDALVVFRSALRQLLGRADLLEIEPVAPDDALLRLVQHSDLNILVQINVCTRNWFQRISSLDEYLDGRPSRLKRLLERKSRAVDKHHEVTFAVVANPGEALERALDEYERVYDRSWKKPEPSREFIRGLARVAASNGWLRLGLLSLDHEVVAAQIWFVQGEAAYIYKLAYAGSYRSKSVGSLLTWRLLRYVHENDHVNKVDYLTGDDAYKRDWMDESRDLYRVTFINWRRPLGLLSHVKWRLLDFRVSA